MSQAGKFSTSTLPPATAVETLTGNSGGPVGPDLSNNIDVVGDGTTITIVGSPGTNTLTVSALATTPASYPTDVLTATPAAGVLNIIGGDGIITSAPGASNTIVITSTGLFFAYTDVDTSPYIVSTNDVYLSVDTSGGPITLEFPDIAVIEKPYYIKDRTGNAAANNITITTVSGLTNIDASPTYIMDSAYQSVSIIGNGSTYEIF